MKKITLISCSIILTSLFTLMAAHETIEFCLGKKEFQKVVFSNITELEEESESSEESKEEKDEELKFGDDIFLDDPYYHFPLISMSRMNLLNGHYHSSDFTSQVFSPPDFI